MPLRASIPVQAARRVSGRQDEVGVAGGLVQVDVDRDHVLEAAQGAVQTGPVGRGEHGIAGVREKRTDLPRPRGLHLLGQHGQGPFTGELGQSPDAASTPVEVAALAEAVGEGHDVDGGSREHRAARPV